MNQTPGHVNEPIRGPLNPDFEGLANYALALICRKTIDNMRDQLEANSCEVVITPSDARTLILIHQALEKLYAPKTRRTK